MMRVIVVFTRLMIVVASSSLDLSEMLQLLPQLVYLSVLRANQELFLAFEALDLFRLLSGLSVSLMTELNDLCL
jgi:hypothetical protein